MGDGIGDFAFWIAVGLGFLGLSLGPIGTAIGRTVEHLAGRLVGGGDRERTLEVEQLSQRVAELQGVEPRLAELEERLDFAERLLTSGQARGPEANTPPEPVEAAR